VKDVIVHKPTLEHFGKAVVATFAAFCATLAPRVITALATSDPLGGEINLFGEPYLRLAVFVSLAIGIGTMFMMWRQPFDPPKIFVMALSFPSLVAGGWNMTGSVQELATNSTQTTLRSMSTLQELNIAIEQPAKLLELESVNTSGFFRQSYETDVGVAKLFMVGSARASTSSEVGKAPLQISQLLVQQQYLVILGTFSDETQAQDALERFRQIVPGATTVRTRSNYYIVATRTPSSISEATQLASQLRDRLEQARSEAGESWNLNYSVRLLPVEPPGK